MKLTEEEMRSIFMEDVDPDAYPEIIFGDWEDSGKYQYQQVIFKAVKLDKYYSFHVTRNGSYFTDYEYEFNGKPYEVEEVEVVTMQWRPVKSEDK